MTVANIAFSDIFTALCPKYNFTCRDIACYCVWVVQTFCIGSYGVLQRVVGWLVHDVSRHHIDLIFNSIPAPSTCPVHASPSHFLMTDFNIIPPSTPRFSKWSLSIRSSYHNPVSDFIFEGRNVQFFTANSNSLRRDHQAEANHPVTRRHIPEERRPQLHRCESLIPRVVHCTNVCECCENGDCFYRLTLEINVVRFFETSGQPCVPELWRLLRRKASTSGVWLKSEGRLQTHYHSIWDCNDSDRAECATVFSVATK